MMQEEREMHQVSSGLVCSVVSMHDHSHTQLECVESLKCPTLPVDFLLCRMFVYILF